MKDSLKKMLRGYQQFRDKYALGDQSIMQSLSSLGQKPQIMVVACCDSRVDPALILQCDPGDLFVVRNVANIVPPCELDDAHHGTSAALEFGIRFLKVKHLILLGHSQCGGIQALLSGAHSHQNDFISSWVSIIDDKPQALLDVDDYARLAIRKSHENCLTFPWIRERLEKGELIIHRWYFDIRTGQIWQYQQEESVYSPLTSG